MRCLRIAAMLLLVRFAASAGAQTTVRAAGLASGPASGPVSVAEQYLFVQANVEREQRGLPALHWDAALYQAATFHAREMAARASISHQYPGEPDLADRGREAGARFSTIAENVAEAPTAVRIHDAWMQSEGHRANLLDGRVNAVGIRVLRRDGELYAVEDFSRTVDRRTVGEQEMAVQSLLERVSTLTVLPATEETRRTCTMETGYAGARKPWFVMRYTTADLTRLPEQLRTQLASGRYHEVQIGACDASDSAAFSSFKFAILLYP
jgi:uncharacterized protein YkwD